MNLDWVQSCITSVSFPETLESVFDMVEKNEYARDWAMDIDVLLNFDPDEGTAWTAPKWMTQGDILFFYHTKKAKQRISKLLKEAKSQYRLGSDIIRLLERAADYSSLYSGAIFGCSSVSGATEYYKKQLGHFDSRCFAPLGQVHIFDYPLSSDRFADFVKIGQNTTTPLYKRQFEGIKQLLSEQNTLPEYLQNSRFGDTSFRNVDQDNWPLISCGKNTRFIHEAQIRAYLLDFLLAELKDKGTLVLEECQCFRDRQRTGIADYFLKVHSNWIPIEAKLNILSEKDVLSQVAKYAQVHSFIPTVGTHTHRGKIYNVTGLSICLIVDQSGVYIVSDGNFLDCFPGSPIWSREELNHSTVSTIRDRIRSLNQR